jgi:hypothetical protein
VVENIIEGGKSQMGGEEQEAGISDQGSGIWAASGKRGSAFAGRCYNSTAIIRADKEQDAKNDN